MFWFGAALVIALVAFFAERPRKNIMRAMATFVLSGFVGVILAAFVVALSGFAANPDNWDVTEVALVRIESDSHYVAITLNQQDGYVYYTFHYREEGGNVRTASVLASRAVIHEQDASDEAVATLWEDKTSLKMFYLHFAEMDFVELLVPRGTIFNNIPIGIKP